MLITSLDIFWGGIRYSSPRFREWHPIKLFLSWKNHRFSEICYLRNTNLANLKYTYALLKYSVALYPSEPLRYQTKVEAQRLPTGVCRASYAGWEFCWTLFWKYPARHESSTPSLVHLQPRMIRPSGSNPTLFCMIVQCMGFVWTFYRKNVAPAVCFQGRLCIL